MKLENLMFCRKKCESNRWGNFSYPNIRVSRAKSSNGRFQIRVSFRMCDSLYESNTHCVYAIAGNRLYFMFCSDSKRAYKLQIGTAAKKNNSYKPTRALCVAYNKEISKFIRDEEYTPKLDNECGLWYIEC